MRSLLTIEPTAEQLAKMEADQREYISNRIKESIEECFNNAVTIAGCQAAINIAKSSGYVELAEEMQADLATQLLIQSLDTEG